MHGVAVNDSLGEDLSESLARLTDSEKQPLIVNFLISEIARILQMPEEKIPHNGTIQDLGIDSLMAMELATTIDMKLGINMPVMTLVDNTTLDSLAYKIVNMLSADNAAGPPSGSVADMVSSLAKIHAEDIPTEELESITREIDNDVYRNKRLIQ
jgi:acyl carrier protein